MSTEIDRLDDIKAALNELLEERIGHLLGVVRAAQSLTRRIVAAEEEIQSQERRSELLEGELAGGARGASARAAEEALAAARAEVARMKVLREELVDQLSLLRVGDE